MPAKFTELKIPVVSLNERSQTRQKRRSWESWNSYRRRSQLSQSFGIPGAGAGLRPEEGKSSRRSFKPSKGDRNCEEGHYQIGLKRKQEEDLVLGDIVRLRRSRDDVPSQEELSKESDVTKKLCLQWDRLEVVNEIVHRRLPGSKLGEEDYL